MVITQKLEEEDIFPEESTVEPGSESIGLFENNLSENDQLLGLSELLLDILPEDQKEKIREASIEEVIPMGFGGVHTAAETLSQSSKVPSLESLSVTPINTAATTVNSSPLPSTTIFLIVLGSIGGGLLLFAPVAIMILIVAGFYFHRRMQISLKDRQEDFAFQENISFAKHEYVPLQKGPSGNLSH